MPKRDSPPLEIYLHLLGAKAGGGITYLRAVFPELIRQTEGKNVRLVLLMPSQLKGFDLPDWVTVHVMPLAASSTLTRLFFDQVILPLWMKTKARAALYCSGSFSPIIKTVPTVVLLRNAIYFDEEFLARELPLRRALLRIQRMLIGLGARNCDAIHYPSKSMRELVERMYPFLSPRGAVNLYGIGAMFLNARSDEKAAAAPPVRSPKTFLYVMNYTLQKNLGFLLEALALAKKAGIGVRVMVTSKLNQGPASCFARDRALIEEHDLIGSGHLVPVGPRHGEELIELYRSVDACIFPSICESFGHPIVESLAMGKPLICADRPYAREICGDSGVYVDPTRPQDMVRLWESWPVNGHKASKRELEGRLSDFSWAAHVTNLLAALGVGGREP